MILAKNLKESILKQLETNDVLRIAASEDDFFSIAHSLPFKVEYHNCEIVTMGLASIWHETLAATLIGIFYQLFSERDDINVLASNSGVQIPKFEGGYYMPDAMVVRGKPILKPNSSSIITNPYIIVEVLSPSTSDYDLSDKLPEYKHLESLQQIIFVNQRKMHITTYTRSANPNIWLNQDFYAEDESVMIDNSPVLLKAIYRKIILDVKI